MAFDRSLRRAACVLLTAALLVPAWGGLARQVRAAAQSEIDALKAEDFSPYYRLADKIRFQEKGNYVDIRAILEFSNICRRKCVYCGLNCRNQALHRYRMTPDEIVDAASAAARAGYRTLVMQSGEDPWLYAENPGRPVKEIKKQEWPSP